MNLSASCRCNLWLTGFLLAAFTGTARGDETADRIAWMRAAKWGVMTHYLADWQARANQLQMSVDKWNEMVDHFNVEGLADQIKSVGAGYHILTIGQNSGYFSAPNATYDKIVGIEPSKCSRRDLIGDMANALKKRGIKLIVYLPSGAPGGDRVAREALQWRTGQFRNAEFQQKWEAIMRDWSLRWGDKVSGWWFDGCYWPNTMYRSPEPPNFQSFAAAARAGNPLSAVAFNPGVVPRLISMTPYEDFTAGEINDLATVAIKRATDGILDGKQAHVLSFLGTRWGTGQPRFTTEQAVQYTQAVSKPGGVITWDVPVQIDGRISEPFIEQLTAIGKAVAENPH
jgi:alpha-L-fucosidase